MVARSRGAATYGGSNLRPPAARRSVLLMLRCAHCVSLLSSLQDGEFQDEITRELNATGAGTLSIANAGPNTNGSQVGWAA